MDCPLCQPEAERVLWRDDRCRVIRVADAHYHGYCRVIWHAHVAEMTDLAVADRAHLMNITLATEAAVRQVFSPTKINLASLGNMVPHLHWHVIARYADDAHFPDPIWAAPKRAAPAQPAVSDTQLAIALTEWIGRTDD
ncbi:HIT family protein [Denitromonas ohlonensis]|jgi:diadenosine tetraphosphate (Ap4A) HIT family hydrolase|uniref:HIT family protein n=2 Tax=Denitromonas TaxID=139331 RepID=A0A558ELI0_9RHOO|nr:HIT family protein [Denitromonas ohlonensis]TVT46044.1 MAG: HIT family protein [Denitromonas halophila]TVO67652.1 HIT family protein [Denitromonas ohlonensis]TVO76510.1 HIT family protein [Denitromonas ohlonensis]TVT74246.1 MAG: HIT family protein [Denitromonas halophila]TVT77173.1 MAG: HIT family protein [Denitromonas halophila]